MQFHKKTVSYFSKKNLLVRTQNSYPKNFCFFKGGIKFFSFVESTNFFIFGDAKITPQKGHVQSFGRWSRLYVHPLPSDLLQGKGKGVRADRMSVLPLPSVRKS